MAIKFEIREAARLDDALLGLYLDDPNAIFSQGVRAFLSVAEADENESIGLMEFPILLVPFLQKLLAASMTLNYRYHRADFALICDCMETYEFRFTYYRGFVFARMKGLESEFEHKFSGEHLREFNVMAYSVYKEGVSKVRSIVGDVDGLEDMLAMDPIRDVIFDDSAGR